MPRTRQPKVMTIDVAEEISRRVPGYRGYQENALRREDDRRFRHSVGEQLQSEARRLARIESQQFRDDYSDFLEEIDAGARKLEYLAESLHTPAPSRNGLGDQAADALGSIDKQLVDELDRLRRVVHELEKAYEHDERFEMNLAELRGITERIADLMENRNVALGS
jgi:hypothetical protein